MVNIIDIKDLNIYLQPIYNLNTLNVEYSEVLLRHSHNISVSDVINYYEAHNKSLELDIFILNEASKLLKKYNIYKGLTINLSASTLNNRYIYKELDNIVTKNGVNKERIIFEINENTYINNDTVLYNVMGLRRSGYKVAIDDLGAGRSAIENVYMVNADMVKFDGIFLNLIKQGGIYLVYDIIQDLHAIGIDTVVERVESKEDLAIAQQLGFKFVQGYVFSKPITVPEYISKYNICEVPTY